MAEEGLAGEPDHDVAVLAQRPEHGQPVDAVEGLAQDVDALGFELVEMGHHGIISSFAARYVPGAVYSLFGGKSTI